jgi:S-adenosylmethionine:tRNA-ribosyltransferase-isomerase (queuine synthetase)
VRISGHLRPGIKFRFRGVPKAGLADARVEPTVAAEAQAVDAGAIDAEIAELGENGEVVLAFEPGVSPYAVGRAPLPPYIHRARSRGYGVTSGEDRTPHAGGAIDRENPLREAAEDARADLERYQTVFARVPGAVAAPTAGLHLTHGLLDALEAAGVRRAEVILHVGSGSFRPLCERDLRNGQLHAEAFELPEATANAIGETRRLGGRVVAVGTTTTRVLETQASADGHVRAGAGETRLFLRPGDRFRVVDALLTNFHLPRSSLLLLVAAFAERERVLAAYREALATGYRFYSYGDAMLIL